MGWGCREHEQGLRKMKMDKLITTNFSVSTLPEEWPSLPISLAAGVPAQEAQRVLSPDSRGSIPRGQGPCITCTVEIALGEGNGTPLQYSCLENPMDGGAW